MSNTVNSNIFGKVVRAAQQDCQNLYGYVQESRRTSPTVSRFYSAAISAVRVAALILFGVGAASFIHGLPGVGNSFGSIVKGASFMLAGHEVFQLFSNFFNYHDGNKHNWSGEVFDPKATFINAVKNTLRQGKIKKVENENIRATKEKGDVEEVDLQRSEFVEHIKEGFTQEEIKGFTNGTLIPFWEDVLKKILKTIPSQEEPSVPQENRRSSKRLSSNP